MPHDQFDYQRWLDDGGEESEWFTYQARVIRVVDGDTLIIKADQGFWNAKTFRARIGGLDTDEIHSTSRDSEEYKRGIKQKNFVESWLTNSELTMWPFVVTTEPVKGKWGRWASVIRRKDSDEVLNESIVEEFPQVEDQ